MRPIWLSYPLNPAEIPLDDDQALQNARASLEPDNKEMGYSLVNMRATILDNEKIIRCDIVDPVSTEKVGEAIRVINSLEIREGINIPPPS